MGDGIITDINLLASNTTVTTGDGLIFTNVIVTGSVGTGQIDSFLSIQDTGPRGGNGIETGYNTDANSLPLEDTRKEHTSSLLLSSLTIININGTDYYRFYLDINEPLGGTSSFLTLSDFRLYLTDQPAQNGSTVVGDSVYTMPIADRVLLDAGLSSGSGNSFDAAIYVPKSIIDASTSSGTYLILYSEFGGETGGLSAGYKADGTYEEWAASINHDPFVPAPGISIEKSTSDGTVASSDGHTFLVGTDIIWTYVVTNTGNVALTNVSLSDNIQGAVTTHTGDAGVIGTLDVGETWTFTLAGKALPGDYVNIGTVTANGGGTTVTDDNPSGYFGAQTGINIDKVTSAGNLVGRDDYTFLVGTALTWTYTVTNTGNVALSNVEVTDDMSVAVTYFSGDTDLDSKLDTTETWTFKGAGFAIDDAYANVGTATGDFTDDTGTKDTASDDDISGYFGAAPGIHIEKVTSAGNLAGGDHYTFLVGTALTWTYTVTNTGNVALSNVVVVDDQNVTVSPISGDTNTDGKLDTTETWIFTGTGLATKGDYVNTGTASGDFTDDTGTTDTVSDDDPSGYFGATPTIEVVKDTVDGAVAGDGHTILAGEDIIWRYSVTNTGNVDLTNINIGDSDASLVLTLVDDGNGDTVLDDGETWVYEATGKAKVGDYANIANVSGSFTDSAGNPATPTDTDGSSYFGADPKMSLVKTTTGVDVNGMSHTGDGISVVAGTAITWDYWLKNDGNVALDFRGIIDNAGTAAVVDDFHPVYVGGDTDLDGKVDTNEIWHFTSAGVAVLGPYVNNAAATASFTDDAHHTKVVEANDGSSYIGTFIEDARARTQGFWQSVADGWDNKVGQTTSTMAKFTSGELRDNDASSVFDVNPTVGLLNGKYYVLLGDSDGNGVQNGAECTLKIDGAVANSILAASKTGDARLIMLAQTIAAQLNIDNGVAQPNDLIKEAVQWLTGKGSWVGNGVNIDANSDGVVDLNAAMTAIAGNSVATNTVAWTKYVDVTQQDLTANTFANGEGLKNALMFFNDGHLVTSVNGGAYVGWDNDGRGGSNVVTFAENNAPDNFWLTLHNADVSLGGQLVGIV